MDTCQFEKYFYEIMDTCQFEKYFYEIIRSRLLKVFLRNHPLSPFESISTKSAGSYG